MQKILILAAEFGDQSVHPCGKDMYVLAEKLSKSSDIFVSVLTARHNFSELPSKVSIKKLDTVWERKERLCNQFFLEKRKIHKFILRVKLHILNAYIDKKNISRTKMDVKSIRKWLNQNREKYDILISVSYPFYIQEYSHIIKKKSKIGKWIVYLLDPYADNQDGKERQRKERIKKEKRLFRQCTNIFAVEEIVKQAKYSPIKQFEDKIRYIPTHLITDNTGYHVKNNTEQIHLIYTGLFYSDIRNPEKLLRYFTRLPKNYILNLYSRGCIDIIKKYKEILGDRLQVNDYILDSEAYNQMIGKADILIDVGNTVSNQIPSKILTYCSFGKPILHFKNCDDEVIGAKFSKYSLMGIIDYSDNIEKTALEIKDFCEKNIGKTLAYDEIKTMFSECTVGSVVEKIKKILA